MFKNIIRIVIIALGLSTHAIFGQEYLILKNFNNLVIENKSSSKEIMSNDSLNVNDFIITKDKVFVLLQSSYGNRQLESAKTYYWGKVGSYNMKSLQTDDRIDFSVLDISSIDKMFLSPDSSKILLRKLNYEETSGIKSNYKYYLLFIKDLSYEYLEYDENHSACGWWSNDEILFVDTLGFYIYNLNKSTSSFYNSSLKENTLIDLGNFNKVDSSSFLLSLSNNIYCCENFNFQLIASNIYHNYILNKEKKRLFFVKSEDTLNTFNNYYIIETDIKGNIQQKLNLRKLFTDKLEVFKITSLSSKDNELLLGINEFTSEKNSGIYSLLIDDNKLIKLEDVNLSFDAKMEYLIIK